MAKQLELTISEYNKLKRKLGGKSWMPRSKPGDRTADGIVFDSKAELAWYLDTIKPGLESGRIRWWCHHPVFYLAGVKYTPESIHAELPAHFKKMVAPQPEIVVTEVKPKNAPEEVRRRFKRNAEQMLVEWGIVVRLEVR